jgi:hypothetical protein
MKSDTAATLGIHTVNDLKRIVIAYAMISGNTFAFHALFSSIKEFAPGGDEAAVNQKLMDHLEYLLPTPDAKDSADFQGTLKLVEQHDLNGDIVPGILLEETAQHAVAQGKFAYAEDAYRLLGIKKEIIGLYAQRGEQFLREGKPSKAAMSFLVAASLDQPIGPNFQYLGPQLHADCMRNPRACTTILPVDELIEVGIHYLLSHDNLSERLLRAASAEQKRSVLGALAQYRDQDIHDLIQNLRKAAEAVSAIHDGKPNEYSPIGPLLLGRATATEGAWQYLREFSYEHPLGTLCVCIRMIGPKPMIIPVVREGKSLIEFLLPPEMLKAQ